MGQQLRQESGQQGAENCAALERRVHRPKLETSQTEQTALVPERLAADREREAARAAAAYAAARRWPAQRAGRISSWKGGMPWLRVPIDRMLLAVTNWW